MPVNICQVALTVSDLPASIRFYSDLFGMKHVFGTSSFRGVYASRIQGLHEAASRCEWLVDDRRFFQLELFKFESPVSRVFQETDESVGYRRLSFEVPSLVEFETKTRCHGWVAVPSAGRGRGLFLRDPDGIGIDVLEASATAGKGSSCRLLGVRMVVADLDRTIDTFQQGLGFELQSRRAKGSARLVLGDMWLDVAQPKEPRPRPQDYRLSDIGIMNVALGFDQESDFESRYRQATAAGFTPNCNPVGKRGTARCVYLNDPQQFSVEMLFCKPTLYGLVGFKRPGIADRLANWGLERRSFRAAARQAPRRTVFEREIRTAVEIAAPVETVWNCLTDFDQYDAWNPMIEMRNIHPAVGGEVHFAVKLGSTKRLPFRARITRYVPCEFLAWKGGNPLSVAGEHYFQLARLANGATRFVHGERFSGLMLPFAWPRLAKGERLYIGMNEALKQRAEVAVATGSAATQSTATQRSRRSKVQ